MKLAHKNLAYIDISAFSNNAASVIFKNDWLYV